MSNKHIDEKYISDFFGIEEGPKGKKEMDHIRKVMERMVVENGTDIIKIDDEPDGMYFLESGMAVCLNREGEQINLMHEGQYFGEYGVLSGQKRLSTIRSVGRTIVYKIGTKDFNDIIREHPDIYGKLMKKVYGQVSGKHSQILALSGMRKGILQHTSNQVPMTKKRFFLQYGILLLIYILCGFLVPKDETLPIFILPLVLMLVYVIVTKRTIESLVAAGILAAVLEYRSGLSASYADAMIDTMSLRDNAFTVFVMALIGGLVNLIAASGAVTAFKKFSDKHCTTPKKVFVTSLGIMAATSIDDGLNMMCASTATFASAKKNNIVREKTGLFFSMLPTVLSSFIPLSLWGIFVIASLRPSVKGNVFEEFCKSIPFNFFSILVVISMVLFAYEKLPKGKQIKSAEKRFKENGKLWPDGSEKYLNVSEPEIWGKAVNVLLPIIVLAVTALAIRSIINGSFIVDSACGLVAALLVTFVLYCAQGLMSPEQFMEHLITGIANSTLPILMYLLTMCFSTLLEQLSLSSYLADVLNSVKGVGPLMPAFIFVASVLLTIALGSSWSMYAIVFPLAMSFAYAMGLSPALCIGAISGAGIAGEKICMFTADALNVGTSIGCNPDVICNVRVRYSIAISGIAFILYLIAGFIF